MFIGFCSCSARFVAGLAKGFHPALQFPIRFVAGAFALDRCQASAAWANPSGSGRMRRSLWCSVPWPAGKAHINPALPLMAFGLAYLIGLTLLLAITRPGPSFFAMGFLWPSLNID